MHRMVSLCSLIFPNIVILCDQRLIVMISEIAIKRLTFSCEKKDLKMLSTKWWLICLSLAALKHDWNSMPWKRFPHLLALSGRIHRWPLGPLHKGPMIRRSYVSCDVNQNKRMLSSQMPQNKSWSSASTTGHAATRPETICDICWWLQVHPLQLWWPCPSLSVCWWKAGGLLHSRNRYN